MLQVSYKGQFLHLAEAAQIELEKSSPLFLIDSLLAEYTMPITVIYDEHNASILGDVFFEYGIKQKQKIEVQLFDNNTLIGGAKMIIDKSLTNTHNKLKGNVQGFFVTGASDFFQSIKNKKLKSLSFGGTQNYSFTSWDAFDNSAGFWQHIHSTWDGNANYVLIPHRNDGWIDADFFDGWVNQLGYGYLNGQVQFTPGQIEPASGVVLFPRLKYVLEQLFVEHGWSVDFFDIGDTHWHKLFLYNCNYIKTVRANEAGDVIPITQLSISIADMISPEIYCADFLLWLCKRYGWAPIFESDTKTCRIKSLYTCAAGTVKDFTNYATATAEGDFSGEIKITAFQNELPKNDASLSTPDFTNLTIQSPVASFSQLPVPTINYDSSVIFCFLENAFYKVEVDNNAQRIWVKHSDNIYNEEPKDYTESISTGLCTMAMQRALYRETQAGIKYYGYFPICDQSRVKEWGLRAIFYHGMVLEEKLDFTVGTMQYPYASPVGKLPNGTTSTPWSNVYKHSDGTTEDGIIKYWWSSWLRLIQVPYIIEQDLLLPLHELAQLKWDDIINIRNQPYLIKNYIQPIPYYGKIKAVLQPLLLNDVDAIVIDPDAVVIYLRIGWENVTTQSNPYWPNYQTADVVVRAFEDAAGTVPYNANGLAITIFGSVVSPGFSYNELPENYTLTGSVNNLKNWLKQSSNPSTGDGITITYHLQPSANYTII